MKIASNQNDHKLIEQDGATSSSASNFHTQIDCLAKAKLLYLVTEKFAAID
jgi:hypothetical protein